MSRTYRVRHLPRLGATRYLEASGRNLTRRRSDSIERDLRKIFPGRSPFDEGLYWTIREALERTVVSRVLPLWAHPQVDWWLVRFSKKGVKQKWNRRGRRHNRWLLATGRWDAEFHGRLHVRDSWDDV